MNCSFQDKLVLTGVADAIYECLCESESLNFQEHFQLALLISKDTDLSNVWSQLALWILVDPVYGVVFYDSQNKDIIRQVANLYERFIDGEIISDTNWASIAEQTRQVATDFSVGRSSKEFFAAMSASIAASAMTQQQRFEDLKTFGEQGVAHQTVIFTALDAAFEAKGQIWKEQVANTVKNKFFQLIWDSVHSVST